MSRLTLTSLIAGLCLVANTTFVFAGEAEDGAATKKIAHILMGVNHNPSAAEKADLKKMAEDTKLSEAVRTIATAIINMEHKVTDADKAKLSHIGQDAKVPATAKEIASVLTGFHHQASAADKEKLAKIAK